MPLKPVGLPVDLATIDSSRVQKLSIHEGTMSGKSVFQFVVRIAVEPRLPFGPDSSLEEVLVPPNPNRLNQLRKEWFSVLFHTFSEPVVPNPTILDQRERPRISLESVSHFKILTHDIGVVIVTISLYVYIAMIYIVYLVDI